MSRPWKRHDEWSAITRPLCQGCFALGHALTTRYPVQAYPGEECKCECGHKAEEAPAAA